MGAEAAAETRAAGSGSVMQSRKGKGEAAELTESNAQCLNSRLPEIATCRVKAAVRTFCSVT